MQVIRAAPIGGQSLATVLRTTDFTAAGTANEDIPTMITPNITVPPSGRIRAEAFAYYGKISAIGVGGFNLLEAQVTNGTPGSYNSVAVSWFRGDTAAQGAQAPYCMASLTHTPGDIYIYKLQVGTAVGSGVITINGASISPITLEITAR